MQLVEVAGSIPDGIIGIILPGTGADSAFNRNEYREYFLWRKGGRCVRLTTSPPSYADCLEIWEPQPLGTLRVCNRNCAGIALPFTSSIRGRIASFRMQISGLTDWQVV